jgi:hypothetical protein
VELLERTEPWGAEDDDLYEQAAEEATQALLAHFGQKYVYFARAADAYKIGITSEPARRMQVLERQIGMPLYLEALVPGNLDVERRLHARFAVGQLHGEWFHRSTPGLEEMVAAATHLEHWPWDAGETSICDPLSEWRIIEGDCREVLPTLPPVDVVIADPPYGQTSLPWDVPVADWLNLVPLKPHGSVWVFGSLRQLHGVGGGVRRLAAGAGHDLGEAQRVELPRRPLQARPRADRPLLSRTVGAIYKRR